MYQINFPAQSNRASWAFIGEITDLDDNPIDLSNCTMVFAATDKDGNQGLLASTEIGNITYPSLGLFRWFFTVGEMQGLRAEQYNTGLTLTNDDGTQTIQLNISPLPIVNGVVP
jgi:hypothetical protein